MVAFSDRWIISQGEAMDAALANGQQELVAGHKTANYLNLAILQSLTWSGHAIGKARFLGAGLRVLSSSGVADHSKVERYAGRYGPAALSGALETWRKITLRATAVDLRDCSVEQITRYQDVLLRAAAGLRETHELRGVGPWLFCGPFKIVLAHRTLLWEDPGADGITMPLGLEVMRGVRYLKRSGHQDFRDLDRACPIPAILCRAMS